MPNITDSNEFILNVGAALLPDADRQKTVFDVSVTVANGRIKRIGKRPRSSSVAQLDLPNQLLLPGFLTAHSHIGLGAATRGIIEPRGGNYSLPLILQDLASDEDLDAMTAFGLAELIRTGCTTQVEMAMSCRQAESYVRVAEKFGARGYPSGMIPNATRLLNKLWRSSFGPFKVFSDKIFNESVAGTLEEIEENLKFCRKFNHAANDRIRPMMASHATDTHTPETMSALLSAAKEIGNGMQFHVAQSEEEAKSVYRRWGLRTVEWMDSLGMFEVPVFGAHMFGTDLRYDPTILANRNYMFATCPFDTGVNGRLQPYPEMLAAGVAVGIGVDAHNFDFIENLKMAVVKGQARYFSVATPGVQSTRPTIDDAVLGSTRITADRLGRDDLGRLEVGAKADLVTVDVSDLLAGSGRLSPEPLSNLLYANGLQVKNVVIDGAWKVFDGNLLFADVDELKENAGRAVNKIWQKLKAKGWLETKLPAF